MSVAPQAKMSSLISGFWIAQSIYLAAKLGIADCFDDAPKTIAQLAVETETEERSLYRLMRALASLDIFTEVSDRCFALTPLAVTLQSDVPNSMRYAAIRSLFRLDRRIEQPKNGRACFCCSNRNVNLGILRSTS